MGGREECAGTLSGLRLHSTKHNFIWSLISYGTLSAARAKRILAIPYPPLAKRNTLASAKSRECGNEPRDSLKGNHQLDGHSLPIEAASKKKTIKTA